MIRKHGCYLSASPCLPPFSSAPSMSCSRPDLSRYLYQLPFSSLARILHWPVYCSRSADAGGLPSAGIALLGHASLAHLIRPASLFIILAFPPSIAIPSEQISAQIPQPMHFFSSIPTFIFLLSPLFHASSYSSCIASLAACTAIPSEMFITVETSATPFSLLGLRMRLAVTR